MYYVLDQQLLIIKQKLNNHNHNILNHLKNRHLLLDNLNNYLIHYYKHKLNNNINNNNKLHHNHL